MNLRRRMENDLESDLREHIEMETRENMERGMSPEDARHAALRKFGNVARIAEETRAVWRWMWAERLLQDTRYALRGLRLNPVFTAVAILTLALGIGMNTAVFSVVSAVLIKPLPYPDPGRLVWLANYNQRFRFEAASAPDFHDWHEQAQSYEEMAGYLTLDSTVMDGDQSAKHAFVSTTAGFWRIAGARAALGRLFSDADRNVAVLTWRIFQQRFGGDPHVLGRVVLVDGRPTTIIGVLPRDFRFLPPPGGPGGMTGEAEVFTPNVLSPELWGRSGPIYVLYVVAKLKPAVSVGQALAELQAIQARMMRDNPEMRDFYATSTPLVIPLQERLVGESRRALVILICAVAFVLLIACANLGNLLLARASARQKEIAIRTAIGAGRGRLLRHFLVEGLTLALLGGAVGVAVAWAADAVLLRVNPAAIPRLGEIAIDWRVLLFTLAISIVAGAIFGLAPLLSLSPGSLYPVLKEGGRGVSAGPLGLRVRRLLVSGELALALVLLTGTGLMVKSFWRMNAHPASFEPEKIAVMKVWLSGPGYREKAPAIAYATRVLEGLRSFPGVSAAAVTYAANGAIEGLPRFEPGQEPRAVCRAASAGYPKVVGIPLRRGRWTADEEEASAVMVNETFVRRFFGGEDPLGQRINIMGRQLATIVGVVGDLKMSHLDADPEPEVLIPYRQTTIPRRVDILVKATDNPAAITPGVRKLVQGLDRSQPPYGVTTLEGALAESIAPRRFNLLLLGTFAAGAVLLAIIGIYGLISYAVTQRTHEIGVRMALGARRMEIVRMVVREGMLLALTGVAAGTLAALGLTRAMATLLFEVKPDDPATFVAVAAALTVTALLASWLPALRAARVDPLTALRYE